ncbi:hypothetical protein DFH06DRAFT_1150850 [Mycena polygramma]|nr:hypothetical protein DFH06DRAFT_1150850 [Mycena polygramma]
MSDRRVRCPPLYYLSPGGENTFVVDHDPNGRFYLVGQGRAVGIFNDPNRANEQTDGFSGYVKKSAKRWAGHGGARELWDLICDEYHHDGCPPQTLPAGFTAPTPVNRPWGPPEPLAPPSPPAFTPTSPRTPRRSNEDEVRSSVSPSPMRAPAASSIPAGPPPPYHRISPVVSSRARPRVAPSTPAPSTPAPSAPSTPRRAPSTPSNSATPVPSQRRGPATPAPSNSGYTSEDDGSDIELASEMWAIEGLPGKLFISRELAFASSFESTIRNPRYASGTDGEALMLFSRGLL